MQIKNTVIACVATAYGADASKITLDTDIREELSNQSMKLVVLISLIEDELDVKIDMRDAAQLKTVNDFVNKVNQLAN